MSTLADVTARLEQINGEGVRQRDDIVAGLELVAEAIENSGMSQEQMLENARHQARMLELLEGIKNGQKGGAGGDGGDGEEGGRIGLLGGLLGAALGGLTGAIIGYAKAWRDMIKAIMPNKMLEVARNAMNSMRNLFSAIGERFSNFMKRVTDLFKNDGPVGKVGSFFASIGTRIADFFKPITDAIGKMKGTGEGLSKIFKPISDGFGKVMGFFKTIGSSLSGFGTMFKAVAGVMAKIFYPLTIIMTVYDTVKGAIEGFSEDGIVGGIFGAFEGLVTSLITVPLDMIKSAVSWVAGFFGFENVEQALDSFSFTDIFSSVMDGVKEFVLMIPEYIMQGFNWLGEQMSKIGDFIYENLLAPILETFNDLIVEPLGNLFAPMGEWFSGKMRMLMGFLEDFGIPEISFDIPIYGAVTLGPWYPFRNENSDAGTTALESETTTSSVSTQSSTGESSESESFRDYIRSTGSITGMDGEYTEDMTVVSVSDSTTTDGNYQANDAFLTFNARTGESRYNGEDVSKDVYMAGKMSAMEGGTTADIELAMARAEAYNQLSWWNSAKALAGSDPIELLAEQEGQSFTVADLVPGSSTGSNIDTDSVAVADANRDAQTGGGNTNVVAPTTNNVNNQTVASPRRSARNQDPTANLAFSPVG